MNIEALPAILDVIVYATDEIEKRKSIVGVFIDLKKALDTIDHGILLNNCIIMAYIILYKWEIPYLLMGTLLVAFHRNKNMALNYLLYI